jgi:hypothetical protein
MQKILVLGLVAFGSVACGKTSTSGSDPSSSGGAGATDSGTGGQSTGGADAGIDTCLPACSDGVAVVCGPSGPESHICDPLQGMSCQGNYCTGACDKTALGKTNVGCDFHPTVTSNAVFSTFRFAVAIASASDEPATITITRGDDTYAEETLEAGAATVIPLPWVNALKGANASALEPPPSGPSVLVEDGAYRVRSTRPIVAYQFNPLEYELVPAPADCPVLTPDGRCFSYTNDASLLLPVNALSGDYFALGWPSLMQFAGFVAITATEDDTDVELLGNATAALQGGGGIKLNQPNKLSQGDVLQIFSSAGPPQDENLNVVWGPDLSGLRVRANHPLQVLSGHAATTLPSTDVCCLNHMEESVLPAETVGKDYFLARPASPEAFSPYTVKILALEPDTHVTFDPPNAASAVTLSPDAVEQLNLDSDVRITADRPIVVTQYLHSQDAAANIGDPAQSVAIPIEQYRSSYVFFTPTTFDQNYVSIIVPDGAEVTLDGHVIAPNEYTGIGSSGHSVLQRVLEKTPVHRIEASEPVGIMVHGYGNYSSYAYPGGLDLKSITVPPPVPR